MKIRTVLLLVVVGLTITACGRKKPAMEKEMTVLTFTPPQASAMAAMACLEAQGDLSSLAEAIGRGIDAGLTVSQMKEAFSQLYAYTGFPRSLNALGTLQRVVSERDDATEGNESTPLTASYDALQQGTAVQTMVSGREFHYDFCPSEDYYLKAHLFGDIFARDVLTYADREWVTVSALCGLKGVSPQLQSHVRGALNMGVTEAQLRTLPEALRAAGLTAEASRCEAAIAVAVDGSKDAVATPSEWPLGDSNVAYTRYFTGQSYLAPMEGGIANVSFEPSCRNHWHIHHGAVQVLVCVSGRGWYQEWGKPAVELKPGVVVAVPEGVKHWHGAAADSWMQHLTYHTDVQPKNSTEWLEPVSDEQYASCR